MSSNASDEDPLRAKLRADAERQLALYDKSGAPTRPVEDLLHELQVHQVELEMQNEELRRAYTALEESRDRYVDLYEFAPIGYLTLTQEGLIEEINLTAAALLGKPRKELIRSRFSRFVAEPDHDNWYRLLLRTLRYAEQQNLELSIKRDDGSVFHARLDCLRVESGEVPLLRVTLTDISERKQAELALQQADRHKAEFLAMLAHELRNPLAPIRNAACVLGKLGLDHPKITWAQKLIERQVDHLTHMVNDLLDLSRVTFDKIKLDRKNVDLASLVEQVMESVRPLAESKGQHLAVRLPEKTVHIEGDPMRLSQVLFNLLENASKYTPNGGQIELDACLEDAYIKITVKDNGMGIAPQLLPYVFDLFQQEDRTLDRPQGGMGIGLTLVKHLVEKHGGRVDAYSPGQGKGSTFTVRLPLGSRTLATQPPPSGTEKPFAHDVRVLVVDDDEAVADSTAMLLDSAGYDACTAPDGQRALELIPSYRPQVVILDIGLKGMDGFETARRIRELPQGRDPYLLAVTGYGDAETENRALESGCDRLLVKPMQWNELQPLLEQVTRTG